MKTQFSNHEAERLQFMTQGVNSLLSGITFPKQRKSTYDKRFFVIISAFFLKLHYEAFAKGFSVLLSLLFLILVLLLHELSDIHSERLGNRVKLYIRYGS